MFNTITTSPIRNASQTAAAIVPLAVTKALDAVISSKTGTVESLTYNGLTINVEVRHTAAGDITVFFVYHIDGTSLDKASWVASFKVSPDSPRGVFLATYGHLFGLPSDSRYSDVSAVICSTVIGFCKRDRLTLS